MTEPCLLLDPTAWLAKTRMLSPAETGIYIILISLMGPRKTPIALPEAELADRCGCSVKVFRRGLDRLIETDLIARSDAGLVEGRHA